MKRSSPTEGSEEVLEIEFSINMEISSTRSLLGRHMDAGVIVLGYVLREIYCQYNEETADELWMTHVVYDTRCRARDRNVVVVVTALALSALQWIARYDLMDHAHPRAASTDTRRDLTVLAGVLRLV